MLRRANILFLLVVLFCFNNLFSEEKNNGYIIFTPKKFMKSTAKLLNRTDGSYKWTSKLSSEWTKQGVGNYHLLINFEDDQDNIPLNNSLLGSNWCTIKGQYLKNDNKDIFVFFSGSNEGIPTIILDIDNYTLFEKNIKLINELVYWNLDEINKEGYLNRQIEEELGKPEGVLNYTPAHNSFNVAVDSNIHLNLNNNVDLDSLKNNISIEPSISYSIYEVKEHNKTNIIIELEEMDANTQYEVKLNNNLLTNNINSSDQWHWSFTTGSSLNHNFNSNIDRPSFDESKIYSDSNFMNISWTEIENIKHYEIQESRSPRFNYVDRKFRTKNTNIDISYEKSNQYYYRVKAVSDSEESDWSKIAYVEP